MANFEILSLDPTTPQIRAPGAGDGYSVPRNMTFASGTTLAAQAVTATTVSATGNITSGGILQALGTVQSSSGADLSLNANGANRDVFLKVNGTTLMTVQGSTSNVGIGTTSPGAKLTVSDASTGALIRVASDTNGSNRGFQWFNNGNSALFGSILSNYTTGILTYDSGGSAYAGFHAWSLGTSGEAMRLTTTGLGIGTTSPGARVDVQSVNNAFNPLQVRYNTSNDAMGFGIANSNGFVYIGYNTKSQAGSDTPIYERSSFATQLRMDSGKFVFNIAGSGTAGNAITFTQAMTLDASGRLLIGATSSQGNGSRLQISGNTQCFGSTGGNALLCSTSYFNTNSSGFEVAKLDVSTGANIYEGVFQFYTKDSGGTMAERARITAAGNFGIGTTSPSMRLHVAGGTGLIIPSGGSESTPESGAGTWNVYGANSGPTDRTGALRIECYSDQNTDVGTGIAFSNRYISSNVASWTMAKIGAYKENNTSGGAGGYLTFSTTGSGGSLAERARITSAGDLQFATTNASPVTNNVAGIVFQSAGVGQFSSDGNPGIQVNRKTNDGDLVVFRQDGTQEGSISVSGNTVSYNAFAGSHWSQLQDGSKPDILRGTVMESINELCVWPGEQNERLPKSKVSDTVGSKKVYGVFMAWDNDWTETNDMYVTAVGAFICRVNGSVTVQEGDLLESNGDGTARVQADDIIRSSTIGKVTSTVKTHQYDDGSYCVPTVLYCG